MGYREMHRLTAYFILANVHQTTTSSPMGFETGSFGLTFHPVIILQFYISNPQYTIWNLSICTVQSTFTFTFHSQALLGRLQFQVCFFSDRLCTVRKNISLELFIFFFFALKSLKPPTVEPR